MLTSCPDCRKKMEYLPELAGKGKPSHYWCSNCNQEVMISRKKRKVSPR
jgi:DNA-directed RNA polymerase subunit RPC12/RpoP